MRHWRLTVLVAASAAVASCGSNDASPSKSRAAGTPTDTAKPTSTVSWFDGNTPLLLAPAHSNDRALVVLADSLAPDPEEGPVQESGTLVRLDGSTAPVQVTLSSGTEGCVDAALQPAPAAAWGVGFVGKAPIGIRVDSIRSISRSDSTALAAMIFRLASAVPNPPGGRFTGLPFSLVDLWRVNLADGTTVVVGTTKRQINQEDSPLEERTLLVAEADGSGNFKQVYSNRSAGPEETVEGSELLAAVALAGGQQLVFSHDYGEEVSYSIVERSPSGAWTTRWASRRFSC
jgi:hypothetical protein